MFWDTYPPASPYPSKEGTRGGGPSVAPGIRTFGICFWIHTPRLRRTPLKEGTRGGGPSVVTWWNMEKYVIMGHRKTRKTRMWACVTGF